MNHSYQSAPLGTRYPIAQAPIGSASCPELVGAVSHAGGLGVLAASWRDLDTLRKDIEHIKRITDQRFAVNLVLAWPQWERLAVCLELAVPVISFSWGDATAYISHIRQQAGDACLTVCQIGSKEQAMQAEDQGAQVLVAQGYEAGGHVQGQCPLEHLLPQVVRCCPNLPVLAAGGITHTDDVKRAQLAGAAGVWVGTRFLCADEAYVHREYQQAILQAGANSTVYGNLFDIGWPDTPHRVLRNSTVRAWEQANRPTGSLKPGLGDVVAYQTDARGTHAIQRYEDTIALPSMHGQVEALALYAGQGVESIHSVEPAGDIVRELATAYS